MADIILLLIELQLSSTSITMYKDLNMDLASGETKLESLVHHEPVIVKIQNAILSELTVMVVKQHVRRHQSTPPFLLLIYRLSVFHMQGTYVPVNHAF